MRLSSNHYIPLQQIRFVRIHHVEYNNNLIYINLYFSHTNRKDNYYTIAYNIVDNTRYLFHTNNHRDVIWKD
jgi:hypothetical protein